jgi:predicted permease
MVTESVLLSCIAGCLGLALAGWGVQFLAALGPQDIPRINEITVDTRVLAFTLGVSILAGVLFGLVPAIRFSRSQPNASLTVNARAASLRSRSRGVLVIAEFALAMILLTGAGLLIRSFLAVLSVDPGFRAERVLASRLTVRNPATYGEILERIREIPGVLAVGGINGIMMLGGSLDPDRSSLVTVTKGDAFRALGIELLKGRFFEDHDSLANAPGVALVNEAYARRFWPGENPLGKKIGELTVVGLIKDTRNNGLERRSVPQFFPAPGPNVKVPGFLVVRTIGDPRQLAASIQAAVRSVDKTAVLWNVETLQDQLDKYTAQRRFQAYLLGLFSAIALILAGVGIYGLLHYSVTQRTREMGIRMALGARSHNVQRMIIREGLVLAGGGILLGIGGAFAATRTISSLLFGVTATDPFTFMAVALALIAIAAIACYVPAQRATKVDPLIALRCE